MYFLQIDRVYGLVSCDFDMDDGHAMFNISSTSYSVKVTGI